MMRALRVAIASGAFVASLTLVASWQPALGADDSKVKSATQQVESGAKKIGKGEVGQGVEEAAKGVGNTVVEGAKFTDEKFKEAGKAAEPPAKGAWEKTKDGASDVGRTVKNFFTRLFSN